MPGSKEEAIVLLTAACLRLFFYIALPGLALDYLTQRIEYLSPLTSYTRIYEGKFLADNGMGAYSNDFLHAHPILMGIVGPFVQSRCTYFGFLVLVDLVSILLLIRASGRFGMLVGCVYAFNPYSVFSSVSLSAQSLHVLVVSLLLHSGLREKSLWKCTVWLAMLIVFKPVLPWVLIFVLPIIFPTTPRALIRSVMLTSSWYLLFTIAGYVMNGFDWSFFYSSVISPIFVSSDVEPNFGIAWGLFMIIFPFALPFFRIVFQAHLLLTILPGYVKFSKKNQPVGKSATSATRERYFVLMICAVLVFQTYPTALDFCLLMALLAGAEEPKYVDKPVKLLIQYILVPMILSSGTATLWLDRIMGNMVYLSYTSVVIGAFSAVAVGQALKRVRIADYDIDQKKIQ